MILQLIYTATQFTAPILLPFLLDFITQGVYPVDDLTHRTIPGWHGYVYSAAIVVSSAIGAIFFYHASLRGWALGIQIKSVLTVLTYRKALYVAPNKTKTGGNITYGSYFRLPLIDNVSKCTSFVPVIWYLVMRNCSRTLCHSLIRVSWRPS
jgi:hypothetical protein